MSQGCPHCEMVADLRSAPSFVFLKKSQGNSRECVFEFLPPCEDLLSPCEEPRLCLRQLNDGIDRRRVPLQDEDHPGIDLHLVPRFPRLCFGMSPERFRSASASVGSEEKLDRAPKMRDFVLLNSGDNLLVTLPSIFSETCVMYSSLFLRMDMFRDWPFPGCSSCVSHVTVTNFPLFLNVAIF